MPVELRPENDMVYRLYSLCRGQYITKGMSGEVVDILIPSIDIAMNWLRIKDEKKRGYYGLKVLSLARADIKEARERQPPTQHKE